MSTRKLALLAATSLGFGVVQLDVSVVNVAIKSIGASLGGGVATLQWVVNAYTLVFASFILTAGSLSDKLGAKRLYVTGFSIFTLASLACGLAPNISTLIVSRAVQGLGAGILVPCSLTLLNHSYADATERKRAVGLWAAGASIALAGGPLIGGLLIGISNWRAIFFINLPLGLIGIVLTLFYARETPRSPQKRLDIPGAISVICCLVLLAAAVINSGKSGFMDRRVIVSYIGSALFFIIFMLREHRASAPMLPLRLFKSRMYRTMSLVGLLINISFYGLTFILSLYFQNTQHLSALQTGLAFAPMTAIVFFGNLYASRLANKIGENHTISLGIGLVLLGSLSLLKIANESPYITIVFQLLAIGAGLSLIVPIITSGQLASVDKSMSGLASGTLNTARQAGSVIGVSLYGSLAAKDIVSGMHRSLIISSVVAVLVLLVISRNRTSVT